MDDDDEWVLVVRIWPHTTEKMLTDYFEGMYGKVKSTIFIPFSGFCYIEFFDPKTASTVRGHYDHTINGNQVEAKRVIPRYSRKRLFVGGLPSRLRTEQIISFFKSYGRVMDSEIYDSFGYISFKSEAIAKVVLAMGSFNMAGQHVWVKLAISESSNSDPGPSDNSGRNERGDYASSYPAGLYDIGYVAGSGHRYGCLSNSGYPQGRVSDVEDGHNSNFDRIEGSPTSRNDPGVCYDIGYDPSLY